MELISSTHQVGGNATLPKSMKAARLAGWVHVIGFVGGVSLFREVEAK
jgi:hypothetical protein